MTRRKSKTRFTREAHFEFGLKLAHIQATLDDAVVRASHVYPIASREMRALERASRAVEHLRSVMDDAICRERPLTDLAVTDAYYPLQM